MATNVDERKINIILDGKQVNASLKEMEAAAAVMNNQLKKMSADDPQRTKLLTEFRQMKDRIGDAKQELYGMEKASLAAKIGMTALGTASGFLLAGGIEGAIGRITGFFSDSSKVAKEFEKSLTNLASITELDLGSEDLKFYEEQAARIGETTTLSAAQAVETFQLIGGAKAELLSNKEALVGVTEEAIKLAEAAGIDLPSAAQSLVGAINQFQLPVEEAGRLVNVLAAGSTAGAAEITDISQSIDKFGVAAASFNVTFEESVGLVELMAEYNLKGAESGTALRNVLNKMSTAKALPTGALEEMERFGVNLDIVTDSSVPLNQRLAEFSKISGDAVALTKVFGAENKIAGEIVLSNVDKFSALTEAVTGTNTATEQAAKNTDNLDADIKALDSVTESWQITIGKGLNVAIRAGVQLLTFFLLLLKEAPKFVKENQDVIYTLGAAILALNVGNIKAAASTLAHNAAEKGRAIATRASAAAQWVLNAAMNANPIGLVVAAVAALVGGFVILYNRSEAVRGGIAGLWAGFKELLNIAGDIALFLLNPLKNAGKIKEIMNSGERLGKAFSDGYNNKIASEKVVEEKKEDAKHEEDKEKAKEKGKDLGKATSDGFAESLKKMSLKQLQDLLETEEDATHKKLIRKRIDFLKELEKEQKEHTEKVKRAQEQYDAALAKTDLERQKLKIELMQEGIDKVLAKLKLQHDQELKELEKQRKIVQTHLDLKGQDKLDAMGKLNEQEKLLNEKFEQEKKAAEEAQHKVDLENWYAQLDEEEEYLFEVKKNQLFNALDAEFQTEQMRLQLHRDNLQQRLLDLQANGQAESVEAFKLKNQILQIDKDKSDGQIANAKRTADLKRQIEQQTYRVASDFLQLGIDLLGQDEKARKKNATAIKAFTIAKIYVDLASEISGYMKHPASTGTMGALGAIQSGFAVVRAGMAISKVDAQQFAEGGSTIPMQLVNGTWQMANGYSGGSSIGSFESGGHVGSARLGLIGEAGAEWVMPNWMLTSPKYAATAAWLEAERQGGGRKFAEGGSTGVPVPSNLELPENRTEELLEQLLERFDNYQAEINQRQRELHTNYYSGNALEADNRRAKAEELASW